MAKKSSPAQASPDRPIVRLRGRLSQAVVRQGTGSEHASWVLTNASHGQVILKRLGANPFELDAPPAPAGCEVEAEGYLLDHELRYTALRQLP